MSYDISAKFKKRNTSYEVIKVIAIILVVFCHSVPADRIEYHFATTNPWIFVVILIRQFGSVGNALFLVVSTWFLTENDNINIHKIITIIADNQLISLLYMSLMLGIGYDIGFQEAVRQVFPFTFSTLWYVTCYVMYYCIHGLVNRALKDIHINTTRVIMGLLLYLVVSFAIGGPYFSELIGFIVIHILTWNIKKLILKWDNKQRIRNGSIWIGLGILGWILGAFILNSLGIRIEFLGLRLNYWNRFYNIFILAISYGSIIVASGKEFYSSRISNISRLSLYMYMITGNQLLRSYIDNSVYDLICGKNLEIGKESVLFVIIFSLVKLIIGIVLSHIYVFTLSRLTKNIAENVCNIFIRWLYK